eukprot:scaffold635_cov535-Prasinococcus_capsulatus_cf.AAC.9
MAAAMDASFVGCRCTAWPLTGANWSSRVVTAHRSLTDLCMCRMTCVESVGYRERILAAIATHLGPVVEAGGRSMVADKLPRAHRGSWAQSAGRSWGHCRQGRRL